MTWLSVIMPTYNGERYVAAALDSVARERTDGIEVIVVDDGSSDRTLEIVQRYRTSADFRVLALQRIGNWVATTNIGLRAANGRYACFLHQDDLWLPGRVDAIRRALDSSAGARLLVHPATFIGPDGQRLGPWSCPLRPGLTRPDAFVERLLVQNFLAIASPVFDRELAVASGGLDESLWYTADWDLWLRLGAMGPVRFIDAALAGFRIHPESQTMARPRTEDELLHQMTAVLARHLPSVPGRARHRRHVRRVAEFSAALNSAFAASARGEGGLPVWKLTARFLRLGPLGWRRYLRDSRLLERVTPRLRLKRSPARERHVGPS